MDEGNEEKNKDTSHDPISPLEGASNRYPYMDFQNSDRNCLSYWNAGVNEVNSDTLNQNYVLNHANISEQSFNSSQFMLKSYNQTPDITNNYVNLSCDKKINVARTESSVSVNVKCHDNLSAISDVTRLLTSAGSGEMDNDPASRFCNKRRIDSGSVGAPAPKIKRKRLGVTEAKFNISSNSNQQIEESETCLTESKIAAPEIICKNTKLKFESQTSMLQTSSNINVGSNLESPVSYSSHQDEFEPMYPKISCASDLILRISGSENIPVEPQKSDSQELFKQPNDRPSAIDRLSPTYKLVSHDSIQSSVSELEPIGEDSVKNMEQLLTLDSVCDDPIKNISFRPIKKSEESDICVKQTTTTPNIINHQNENILELSLINTIKPSLPTIQPEHFLPGSQFQKGLETESCNISVPHNNTDCLRKLDKSPINVQVETSSSQLQVPCNALASSYSIPTQQCSDNTDSYIDKPIENSTPFQGHLKSTDDNSFNKLSSSDEIEKEKQGIYETQYTANLSTNISSTNEMLSSHLSSVRSSSINSCDDVDDAFSSSIKLNKQDIDASNYNEPDTPTAGAVSNCTLNTVVQGSPLSLTTKLEDNANTQNDNQSLNAITDIDSDLNQENHKKMLKCENEISQEVCGSESDNEPFDNLDSSAASSLVNDISLYKSKEDLFKECESKMLAEETHLHEKNDLKFSEGEFSHGQQEESLISDGDNITESKMENKSDKSNNEGHYSSDEATSDSDSMKRPICRRAGAVTGLSAKPKVKNLRRNIRDILGDDKLEENTIAAQKEEQLRLQRLQEKRVALREYMEQQQEERLVAEVAEAAEAVTVAEAIEEAAEAEGVLEENETTAMEIETKVKREDLDIVVLSSEEEGNRMKEESDHESSNDGMLDNIKCEVKSEHESFDDSDQKSIASSESDSDSDVVVLSHSDDEEDDSQDATNSGAHINDEFNVPDAQSRVLVNVGHPEKEEDIFLAPQLAQVVKPHQIGGIRFLYDNIVESLEQFKTSNGFGCILAHSMGLGKTLQVVALSDVYLRHTGAKTVLIIVPINTIQNWQSEYNQWLADERPQGLPEDVEYRTRTFKVFLLNDSQKNIQARAKVINCWHEEGGVLLMGYELYRQLSLKKTKKPKKKKSRKKILENSEVVDIEEEDKNKELLDEIQKALVKPGPDLVICDEGHRIKNAHANISQALKSIQTKRRVVLTGYPLQNNLLEYWCMVDFIRPNYLGTKTEFCNMFERPIQNGQCVDSTPQDVKIMRYRSHVLHSLLEGFVQRRGHSVLAKTLPSKQEHVLLCRMTKIQRSLYSAYMADLNSSSKSVANPLKAFAVCCKIWNHPDVLYNFVMKRMNEDCDLELDELVNKTGKSKKASIGNISKGQESNLPSNPALLTNWGSNGPQMQSPVGIQPQLTNSSMANIGMSTNLSQHDTMTPNSTMMHSSMGSSGMGQNQENSNQHQNMGIGRNEGGHSGMGMNYGMGMYNMQQNYNMHQMPPPFNWSYNQGYPPNHNDPNNQIYPPSPYGAQYPQQYQQSHPMQQLSQHQLPMAHIQQALPPSQNLPGYPPMAHPMLNAPCLGIGPPPAHPSLHSQGHLMSVSNSQPMLDQNISGVHQQNALNLSHQPSNTNQELQSHQGNHSLMNQSNSISDSQNQNFENRNNSNDNKSFSQNLSQQARSNSNSSQGNFQNLSPENLTLNNHENSFRSNEDHLSNLLNQNMKDLGIGDQSDKELDMEDNKESLINLRNENNSSMEPFNSQYKHCDPKIEVEDKKFEMEAYEDKKNTSMSDTKNNRIDEDEKKEEKKEDEKKDDVKKEELSYEWAENILKEYVPGKLENSTKFQIFFKILEGCLKVGDRMLVFSQSLFTLSQLEEYLQRTVIYNSSEAWAKNRSYFRLDGSTSAQEREKLIKEFNCNPNVHLFLVSTRAGSLGINLVGANRVIVFDASFNPCHDTQAVCRVYRYGQHKPCHIYRLVTDNSLERRIYDRQVNKQGISDRIVDEMNPDAHLSSKEIGNLLVEDEEDPEPEEIDDKEDTVEDEILKQIIKEKSIMFTRMPFQHESLLVDRKDKKLSNAEKRLAKRSYELEKQANISYSRPYSSFYPKTTGSQAVMMGAKIGGVVYAKPVGSVRPMQAEIGHKIDGGGTMMHRPSILSRSGNSNYPVENLAKQGVSVQQITVPKDVSIPTNSGDGKPIQLKAGQSVMVIKTQKGMYLRLSDGKIVAIRVPPEEAFGMPLNQGSVTIVPTMINSQRSRSMSGRGGIPSRRGRPPMSAQYALGQVVPKGTPKGQMAVRILRKPIVTSRGAKSYQTIAVPVSSSAQATLLNKSVVITPAKPGAGQSKYLKDLKISPKVQITPVPSKNRAGLSSIAGTSGLTKRLNRNNRIITAQALATKTEEVKQQNIKKLQLPLEKSISNENLSKQVQDESQDNESYLGSLEKEPISSISSQGQMETDAARSDQLSHSSSIEMSSEKSQPLEKLNFDSPSPKNTFSNLEIESSMSKSCSSSPVNSEQLPQADNARVDDSPVEQSKNSYTNSPDSRLMSVSTPTESDNSISKPMSLDNSNTMSNLHAINNLISSTDGRSVSPSNNESSSSSLMSNSTITSPPYSGQSLFSSSQPLFQPFLQQTMNQNSPPVNSITTVGIPAFSDSCLPSWSKGSGSHSNRNASSGSHIAPQIQSAATDLTSQSSSYLSPNGSPYTTTSQSPIHGLQALTTSHLQTPSLPFSNMTDNSISSQQIDSNSSISLHNSSTSGSTLSTTTLSNNNSQGDGRSSLNLPNLSSQSYPHSSNEDILTHPSSALDYLNYSLTASSSAFRRPEFQSGLPSEIQNLLSPTSLPQVSSSSHSASVSSPSSFTAQASPYSQYASSYRSHTGASSGFRTPPSMAAGYYPGQYGAYSGQYPNLSTHPTASPQPPSMGQYGSLQSPTNPYQGYPPPPPPPPAGTGIPPYPTGGFGHASYPPM